MSDEIAHQIVRQVRMETRLHDIAGRHQDQRVTVGIRARREFSADDAARPGAVIDD